MGLFTALIGNLLWLGMVNVSADDTVISDSPTVSALTKRLKLQNSDQSCAEKLWLRKRYRAKALATNMVSEVAVEYTANTYPAGQCTWGAKEMAPWVGNYWGNGGDWALVRRLDMKWELLQKLALLLYGQMEATVMLPM